MKTQYLKRDLQQGSSSGQALVEFALIMPILMFVMLGIIDYGRVLFVYSAASTAARDAARNATLVGTDPDSNQKYFVSCPRIDADARNILFADITDVNILYYRTEITGSNIALRLEDIKSNIDAVFKAPYGEFNPANSNAVYDCNSTTSIPDPDENGIKSGDLMVIRIDAQIEFITPVISNVFPTIDFIFRSQRTLVSNITLYQDRLDYDNDGLNDQWEFENFGCLYHYDDSDDNTDYYYNRTISPTRPSVAITNEGLLIMITGPGQWAWVRNWEASGTPRNPIPVNNPRQDGDIASAMAPATGPGGPGPVNPAVNFPANCATEDLRRDTFVRKDADGNNVPIDRSEFEYLCPRSLNEDNTAADKPDTNDWRCYIPALALGSAVDDSDGDGLLNGVEEEMGSRPMDNRYRPDNCTSLPGESRPPAYYGQDTDCDGLFDYQERINGTKVNDPDSDDDGLLDGEEVNTHRTDPMDPDSDGDNLSDGEEVNGFTGVVLSDGTIFTGTTNAQSSDTDGDGIRDGDELKGYSITYDLEGRTFTISDVRTHPDNPDTDGDGLNDGYETGLKPTDQPENETPQSQVTSQGYLIQNDYDGTIRVRTNPLSRDTDGDGIEEGVGNPDPNPTRRDTDRDGLTDFEEVDTYGTLADNPNSDRDLELENKCPNFDGTGLSPAAGEDYNDLNDYYELRGPEVTAAQGYATRDSRTGFDPMDADGDGINNARELDSDADGLSDCDEFYIWNTNPYYDDSDGDGKTDAEEVAADAIACRDPRDASDASVVIPCDNTNTDFDKLPDSWETTYFTSGTLDPLRYIETDDPDNDNCNNTCELVKRTDPTNPDSDNDGIRDGYEIITQPMNPDSDNDTLLDGEEYIADPNQTTSGAAFPVAMNASAYPQRHCPGYETQYRCTDPLDSDSDDDGLNDSQEVKGSSNLTLQPFMPNLNSVTTDPLLRDTDNDGLTDGVEVNGLVFTVQIDGTTTNYGGAMYSTNPNNADTDGDGLKDSTELNIHRTNPLLWDTDRDTLADGTTAARTGELGSDLDGLTSLRNFGTSPNLRDTDGDKLFDPQEVYPGQTRTTNDHQAAVTYNAISTFNIQVNYNDGNGSQTVTITINDLVPGANLFNRDGNLRYIHLHYNNTDTDSDGISDYDELMVAPITDPLDADTDNDGALDGDESKSGATAPYNNPLVAANAGTDTDKDDDGIPDTIETDPNSGYNTDPNDNDSDDDGLSDGLELLGPLSIKYTYTNSDGTTTTTVDELITLVATGNKKDSPFGWDYGYDMDYDGLSDSYELYWYDLANSNFLSTFNTATDYDPASSAQCPNLTAVTGVTQQPLDPRTADTDGDGLFDGFECTEMLNSSTRLDPFNAQDGTTILNPIQDADLRIAVSNAISGNTLLAAAKINENNRGLVAITIERVDEQLLTPGNTNYISSLCGDTVAITSAGDINEYTNECAYYVDSAGNTLGSEPANNTGAGDDTITVLIAPSAVYQLLYDTQDNKPGGGSTIVAIDLAP